MPESYETERREFVRIKVDIPVRYKFLSKVIDCPDEIFEGTTGNLGGGGMLLVGKVPDPHWYAELLMQRIVVGVNFLLPSFDQPIKALCRVSWIEAPESPGRVAMGLKFKEITRDHLDEIFRYVIKAQLR
jgi:c-di-GMP-binding flagellar brake protein YcgR